MSQRRLWVRGGGSPLAALAALFTTLCCLGFPALVGLLSALGAGFLPTSRYLEPGLSATLLLTLLIAGLHLRRHRQPGPFLLSLVAAGSVFFAIYGTGLLPHASGSDHMADGMAATPTWSLFLAYGAILVQASRASLGSLALPAVRAEGRTCPHVLCSCFSGKTKGRCLMRRIGGIALTVTGLLACPCHLIITLPLLLSLLAGTALGSFLSHNTGLVYTGAGTYFVVALALGYWFLLGPKREKREMDAACSTCVPIEAETRVQERSPLPMTCLQQGDHTYVNPRAL